MRPDLPSYIRRSNFSTTAMFLASKQASQQIAIGTKKGGIADDAEQVMYIE